MAATPSEAPILVSLFTSHNTEEPTAARGHAIQRAFMAGCLELADKTKSAEYLLSSLMLHINNKKFSFLQNCNLSSPFPLLWEQNGCGSGKCVVFFVSNPMDFQNILSQQKQIRADDMSIFICDKSSHAEIFSYAERQEMATRSIIPVTYSPESQSSQIMEEDIKAVLQKIEELWAAQIYRKSLVQTPSTTIDPARAISALNEYLDTPATCHVFQFSDTFQKSSSNKLTHSAVEKLKTMLTDPKKATPLTQAEIESVRSDATLFNILYTHHLLSYLSHAEPSSPASTSSQTATRSTFSCSLQ
jgi:hypothetical protein